MGGGAHTGGEGGGGEDLLGGDILCQVLVQVPDQGATLHFKVYMTCRVSKMFHICNSISICHFWSKRPAGWKLLSFQQSIIVESESKIRIGLLSK